MSSESVDIWTGGAVFSPCGSYRYSLNRERKSGRGKCAFIMLNPSTADANKDDPTIRRCVSFTRLWGYRSLEVVNLFAFRATDPRELVSASDPVGPDNDRHVSDALADADLAVAAWGDHGAMNSRAQSILTMAVEMGAKLWSLGINRSGEPRHPLYIPASNRPKPLIVTANMLG